MTRFTKSFVRIYRGRLRTVSNEDGTAEVDRVKSLIVLSLNPDKEYQKIEIPRFGKRVDLSIKIGPEGDQTDRYLATLNLNALGFTMNIKRHMGELKSIYVRR